MRSPPILLLLLLPISAASLPANNLFEDDGGHASSARRSPALPRAKDEKIIGGSKADSDRYPYMVSLQDGDGHFCGGTLIGKDVVLSAGHCLDGCKGDFGEVRIGSSDKDSGGEVIGTRDIVFHPGYDSSLPFGHDVALVFLEGSTKLDVPLVRLNDDSSFDGMGGDVITVGWGDTKSGGDLSDELLEVNVDVMSNDDCEGQGHYKGMVEDSMICTDEGGGHCQGDSGGPLIARGNSPEEDIEIGVVSWGTGCGDLPHVYARVSEQYDWIKETACSESNDPPPGLCGPPPTPPPTRFPTRSPTLNPTRNPTESPTRRPTRTPSASPSASPSSSPTDYPSASPSASPSAPPTDYPSATPSASPTDYPSASPTDAPSTSRAPTSPPSMGPTLAFSEVPSTSPTTSSPPSSQPSAEPSWHPTGSPSASPTISSMPSHQPTSSPSISSAPTATPSASPSASSQPTDAPTSQPSSRPSEQPSNHPSQQLSSAPSSQPSTQPTSQPSVSTHPTTSASPSSEPSWAPSFSPSDSPSTTTSPTASSGPTLSAPPTTDQAISLGSGLFIDFLEEADTDGDGVKNASNRIGHRFATGAQLLLCCIVLARMVL